VGSHRGEYEAANVDFSRRGRLLDEGIAAMARAWETAGDIDERYRHDPATPAIPVWLAGTSDATLSRAARVADGWVPLFIPPDEYRSTRRRLFDLAAGEGRDPDAIDTSVVAIVCVGDSAEIAGKAGTAWLSDLYALPPKAFDRHLIAGTAEDCAAGIAAYHDAGAGHVVVMVAADETLDHFGPLIEAFRSGSATATSIRPPGVAP
jgi:alkanesulfonate monooxygenase SsuD/methylene tetrahydromethanopterin reductase-like flavin-dependent oxidoreductase (luciferase family)